MGYWTYKNDPKTGKRTKVRVETPAKGKPSEQELRKKRSKFVNEDTIKDPGKEVSNKAVKGNAPFGKKLRDISPKKEKSGLKGDLINPNSDGDWQTTNGMDRTISMQNIQKFDQHIGDGNDQEPFKVATVSGKDGRKLAPDVGFKNAPERLKKVKGIQEEVEEIDELSDQTQNRYLKKAIPDRDQAAYKGDKHRLTKRSVGISRAKAKREHVGIRKEDHVENVIGSFFAEKREALDELSPETVNNYKAKAFISQHRGGDKSKPFSDGDQKNYNKRQKGIDMARRSRMRKD